MQARKNATSRRDSVTAIIGRVELGPKVGCRKRLHSSFCESCLSREGVVFCGFNSRQKG